jgi:hypothetical protein
MTPSLQASLRATLVAVSTSLHQSCADQAAVDAIAKRVHDLELGRVVDQTRGELDRHVYLTPGAQGYQLIETDIGRLTVMLSDVQPYANGSRVTIQLGNPLSATVNGGAADFEWGQWDSRQLPIKRDSRRVTFTTSLRAGTWTNVRVVLEGVPPGELGYVRISNMVHGGISLSR